MDSAQEQRAQVVHRDVGPGPGVLLAHPDLDGQFSADNGAGHPGYDFVSDLANALDGDGIDPDPDDPGDDPARNDSSFHGTHVAGTVSAATNNGQGVAGVAGGARVMPLRVLGAFGGSSYDLVQALRYAAGLPNASGRVPTRPADVINLSLGGGAYSQAEQDAISAARAQGVVVVAAAGNSNSAQPSYPAAYDGVTSVAAVDAGKVRAAYSNYGPTVDVAAPGGGSSLVWSTLGSDAGQGIASIYGGSAGTSMAAPHVSGVVALMKSVHDALTPAQFDCLLPGGQITEDLGDAGRADLFGHGLIRADQAIGAAADLAAGTLTLPPRLLASRNAVNFGSSLSTAGVTLSNPCGGSLSVSAATSSAPGWLSVTPASVDAEGLGTYTLSIDRTALPAGSSTATVTFTSTANSVTIAVAAQAYSASTADDAGWHYVLLIDTATGQVLRQDAVGAVNGRYAYGFAAVPAGRYLSVAGSDADNDGLICDPGETCGAYVALGQETPVVVSGSRAGIDFGSGFNVVRSPDAWACGVPREDAAIKRVE